MDEPQIPRGWTIETYATHNEAMRRASEKFESERDRRYSEVALEREKALKIKETADLAALELARDIQVYKDEKANELREQINSERGLYATKGDVIAATEKIEATIAPLIGTRREGVGLSATVIYAILAVIGILGGLYLGANQTHPGQVTPVTVTTTTTVP